jgi:hypothetical protein
MWLQNAMSENYVWAELYNLSGNASLQSLIRVCLDKQI